MFWVSVFSFWIACGLFSNWILRRFAEDNPKHEASRTLGPLPQASVLLICVLFGPIFAGILLANMRVEGVRKGEWRIEIKAEDEDK